VFKRLLIAAWALFLTAVSLIFVIRPKPGAWTEYARALPLAFVLLVFSSLIYGVSLLYREGMSRARRR
jgi:hypothetical protein